MRHIDESSRHWEARFIALSREGFELDWITSTEETEIFKGQQPASSEIPPRVCTLKPNFSPSRVFFSGIFRGGLGKTKNEKPLKKLFVISVAPIIRRSGQPP